MGKYTEFHKRSIDQRDEFWAEQSALIDWQAPPKQICDFSRPPFARGSSAARPISATTPWTAMPRSVPTTRALIYISTETNKRRAIPSPS
jgi:propionyl-CoA synthetase